MSIPLPAGSGLQVLAQHLTDDLDVLPGALLFLLGQAFELFTAQYVSLARRQDHHPVRSLDESELALLRFLLQLLQGSPLDLLELALDLCATFVMGLRLQSFW